MRVARCFSFDPVKDKPLLDYIDSLPNASAKIRELLRDDMGESDDDPLVSKIVKGVLSQLGTTELAKREVSAVKVADSDIKGIMAIMNMK